MPPLTMVQRARVEHARRAAAATAQELAAAGGITERTQIHPYAFGYVRSELARLLRVADELTAELAARTARLAAVADSVEEALYDQHASRQLIAEDVARQLRAITEGGTAP